METPVPNWIRRTLAQAKQRAKKYGREFDLDASDIQEMWQAQDGRCYWFQVPFQVLDEARPLLLPTLDRVDSARGYTRDNVVLASLAANYAKRNADMEDWEVFLEHLRESITFNGSVA